MEATWLSGKLEFAILRERAVTAMPVQQLVGFRQQQIKETAKRSTYWVAVFVMGSVLNVVKQWQRCGWSAPITNFRSDDANNRYLVGKHASGESSLQRIERLSDKKFDVNRILLLMQLIQTH
jgi:hypothetical protein